MVVAIESLVSIPFVVAASAIGLVVAVALALAAWTITGMQARAVVAISRARASATRAETAQAEMLRQRARELAALAEDVRTESALAFQASAVESSLALQALDAEVADLRAELDELTHRTSDWLMPRRVPDQSKNLSLILPLVQEAVATPAEQDGQDYAEADRDLVIDIVREISLLDGEPLPERQILDLAGMETDDSTGRRISA